MAALLILSAAWPGTLLAGGPVRVTVTVPSPPRLDAGGLRKTLVTRLRIDREPQELDLDREMVTLLRRELRKKTDLEILGADPPALPEQPVRELLANSGFWRRLAEGHGADLVWFGAANMTSVDGSSYVTVDEISPITGQRVRRTRWLERETFTLDLSLFVMSGRTGQILFEDRFTAENTLNGHHNDPLSVLYDLFEQFQEDVTGIVAPRLRTAQRFLFTE